MVRGDNNEEWDDEATRRGRREEEEKRRSEEMKPLLDEDRKSRRRTSKSLTLGWSLEKQARFPNPVSPGTGSALDWVAESLVRYVILAQYRLA